MRDQRGRCVTCGHYTDHEEWCEEQRRWQAEETIRLREGRSTGPRRYSGSTHEVITGPAPAERYKRGRRIDPGYDPSERWEKARRERIRKQQEILARYAEES